MLNPLRKMWTNINLIKFANTYVPGFKADLNLKPSFCFPIMTEHTSCNTFYKWTKISSLEIIILELKNDGKKWSRIYLKIDREPSEIPAKLPGQFSHSGQQQL